MDELKSYRPLTEGYTGVIETLEQDPYPLLNAALRTRMILQSEAIGVEDHNVAVRTPTNGKGFTFNNVSVPAWVIRLGGGYKGIIPITAAGILKLPSNESVSYQLTSDPAVVPSADEQPKPKKKRKSEIAHDAHNEPEDVPTFVHPDDGLLSVTALSEDEVGENGEALFNDDTHNAPIALGSLGAFDADPNDEQLDFSVPSPTARKSAWKKNIESEALVEQAILDVYLAMSRDDKQKVRRKMESMLGGLLVFRVIHIEQESCLVLLSRRLALQSMANATWSKLKVGQKVIATTKKVLKWHAFCDIGGVSAILPANELINGRVADARSMLRENTTYEVIIKELDKEKGRVLLSMKALTADPWLTAIRIYHKGSRHIGHITSFAGAGGVFVQLEPGVSIIASRPVFTLTGGPQLKLGDRVLVGIQHLDMEKRRIHGKILIKK